MAYSGKPSSSGLQSPVNHLILSLFYSLSASGTYFLVLLLLYLLFSCCLPIKILFSSFFAFKAECEPLSPKCSWLCFIQGSSEISGSHCSWSSNKGLLFLSGNPSHRVNVVGCLIEVSWPWLEGAGCVVVVLLGEIERYRKGNCLFIECTWKLCWGVHCES